MDRLAPTRRPSRAAQGTQRWHGLLFSHWEVPAAVLRPLVPASLELDAFEGRHYVGVVAFSMQNVRPYHWAPPFPTAREFGEVNLRTYVHLAGGEPGVYFFSLDAASWLAVRAARALWGLPYFYGQVQCDLAGSEAGYRVVRSGHDVQFEARARVGAPLDASAPGTLEFFLCERYQFYAQRRGRLRRARVHHAAYALHTVEQSEVGTQLLHAAGLPSDGTRTPDYFSPGVDVEVFSLEDV